MRYSQLKFSHITFLPKCSNDDYVGYSLIRWSKDKREAFERELCNEYLCTRNFAIISELCRVGLISVILFSVGLWFYTHYIAINTSVSFVVGERKLSKMLIIWCIVLLIMLLLNRIDAVEYRRDFCVHILLETMAIRFLMGDIFDEELMVYSLLPIEGKNPISSRRYADCYYTLCSLRATYVSDEMSEVEYKRKLNKMLKFLRKDKRSKLQSYIDDLRGIVADCTQFYNNAVAKGLLKQDNDYIYLLFLDSFVQDGAKLCELQSIIDDNKEYSSNDLLFSLLYAIIDFGEVIRFGALMAMQDK